MKPARRERQRSSNRPVEFFRGFLKNPKEVGSIIPSSPFLTRRVLEAGAVRRARVIVELGPGTGVLTRAILRHMPAEGVLVAIEINPDFVEVLQRECADPRLSLYEGSATDVEKALAQAGATQADLVVSGIPFSTMDRGDGRRTLEAAKRALAPEGRFVAYQVRSHVRRFAEPIFGPAEKHTEIWNIPPMRIYVWKQPPADPRLEAGEARTATLSG